MKICDLTQNSMLDLLFTLKVKYKVYVNIRTHQSKKETFSA